MWYSNNKEVFKKAVFNAVTHKAVFKKAVANQAVVNTDGTLTMLSFFFVVSVIRTELN